MRSWLALVLLSACDPQDISDSLLPSGGDTDVVDTTPKPINWHGDVRPIFEHRCNACHREGGLAPFSMEHDPAAWASGPPPWVDEAVDSIVQGRMPPWKPSTDCAPIVGERVLTDDERATVLAWADNGFPEGDPADYVPPPPPEGTPDGPPDLTLDMPEPFTPDTSRPDDYQCFILDYDSSSDQWMTGFDVLPDHLAMVHHVLLFQISPDDAAQVEALDAASPDEPGYDCLFDPGVYAPFLGGWAPGQPATAYGPGIAKSIPAGSRLVLQIHYNTQDLPAGRPAPADQSAMQLWLMPQGQEPEQELYSIPMPADLYLPAGDPEVEAELDIQLSDFLFGIPEPLIQLFADKIHVMGVFPHMHQLGHRIRLDINQGGDERCMVAIDDWDFAWQQGYYFPPEAWYTPDTSDRIRLQCVYDNSAENQPVHNGVQGEPRDVYWGEGTSDEMCLMFLETLVPPGLIDSSLIDDLF
ncbi:MAG TPA: hypothetical protein PKA64_05065 [Myxococcota bacterium]|nr:hypothetical protein [Myxococcota bacterium]